MDIGVLLFIVIAAVIVRAVIKAVNWANPSDNGSTSNTSGRRRQIHRVAERMRAARQQTQPSFPQPPSATYAHEVGGPGFQAPPMAQPRSTAPFQQLQVAQPRSTAPFEQPAGVQQPPTADIAPPSAPFTARWPSGAPTGSPPRMAPDPVVVEVAPGQAPESAFPIDEPTGADSSPDTTGDTIENATAPERKRYELSSSLDTTLSTSLTSSTIREPGSVSNGPQTVALPPDIEQQVRDLMAQGYEVMAVRLVCDAMDVGILDAHKTVRTVAGLPTLM